MLQANTQFTKAVVAETNGVEEKEEVAEAIHVPEKEIEAPPVTNTNASAGEEVDKW